MMDAYYISYVAGTLINMLLVLAYSPFQGKNWKIFALHFFKLNFLTKSFEIKLLLKVS